MIYQHGFFLRWRQDLPKDYGIELQDKTIRNVVNVLTNEFLPDQVRKPMQIVFLSNKLKTVNMNCLKGLARC